MRLNLQSQTYRQWNFSKTTVEPFTLLGPSVYYPKGVEVQVQLHGVSNRTRCNSDTYDASVGTATVSAPGGNRSASITCSALR